MTQGATRASAKATRQPNQASLAAPKRSELVTIRLTSDELADLRAVADRADLSVADYLRRAMNHMMARGAVLDPNERAWATGIAEELRRTGINLNQVARAVNGGRIGDTRELASELTDHIEIVHVLAYAYGHLADGAARIGRLVATDGEGAL